MKITEILLGIANNKRMSNKERIACRNAVEIIKIANEMSEGLDVFVKDVEYIDVEFTEAEDEKIGKS